MLHPRNRITRQRFASKHSRLSYSNRTVLIDLEMSKFPTPSPLFIEICDKMFFSSPVEKKSMAIDWNPSVFQTIVFYASLFFHANNLNWMEKEEMGKWFEEVWKNSWFDEVCPSLWGWKVVGRLDKISSNLKISIAW